MLLRPELFDRTVSLFYEAAAVPELWPEALDVLGSAAGAAGSTLTLVGSGDGAATASPTLMGLVEDHYAQGWVPSNPYMRRGLELTARGWQGLITSENMLSQTEAKRDVYVNEYRHPIGMGPVAGIVLAQVGQSAMPMTLERSVGCDPFDVREIEMLNNLVARLQMAAELAVHVGLSTSRNISEAFAQSGREIVLLDGACRVLYRSRGIESLVDGVLAMVGNFLSSWDQQTTVRLSAAIARAVSNEMVGDRINNAIALPRRDGRKPIVAQVLPIAGNGQDVFMLARALIVMTDLETTEERTVLSKRLGALGLSPAETRLARRIGNGERLLDIADAEGITLETARDRLKSVFAKTDTHRQSELALLVARICN